MPLRNYKTFVLCSLILTWSQHVNAQNQVKDDERTAQQIEMETIERLPFSPEKDKYVDCRTPINYKQKGFKQEDYLPAFQDFQQRLRSDVASFTRAVVAEKNLQNNLTPDRLKNFFGSSIDTGEKGVSLIQNIAGSLLAQNQRVIPPMWVMLKNIIETTCPVGFGGPFSDDLGRKVELWYIALEPENDALEVFKEPRLPKYGAMERGTFPTIIFVREDDGHLKWYGVSQEMASILSHGYNIQLF